MSLLDQLTNRFLGNNAEFARFAEPEEQKAGKGLVDIFKKNEQGQEVRLQRPENQPFTFAERIGSLLNQGQTRDFSQFEEEPQGFNILSKLGQITGLGSPLWAQGLDIDLQKGDEVPNAVPGTVEFVGNRGGFGKQVRVRGDDGRSYWYSHLDTPNVEVGQRIGAGQGIGLGGNTGNVIPGPGGDGSHLDLTVQDDKGAFLQPNKIRDLLKGFG